MECNKDEATRAKAIAESKLEQKDFLGAKKLALIAQNLYPGLDGISQMLTTLNVYLFAEDKISGEVDWYQVLGVDPSADDGTIKRQYRKLALILHPDKNKSVGADGAFQLISEAQKLLTDKEMRAAYNQRTGYMGFQQKVPTQNGGLSAPCKPSEQKVPAYSGGQSVPPGSSQQKVPSAPPRRRQKKGPSAPPRRSQQKVPAHAGGPSAPAQPSHAPAHTGGPPIPTHSSGSSTSTQFSNSASRTKSTPKSKNRRAKVPMTPNPATFWTVCRGCHTQYEYHKEYRLRVLLCQRCHNPFLAVEIAMPTKFSGSARPVPWTQWKSPSENLPKNACNPKGNVAAAQKPGAGPAGQTSPNSVMNAHYQQGPLPGTANTDNRFPSTAQKPGNAVPLAHDNLKRSHTESHGSAGWEGCFKKGKLDYDNNINGLNYVAQGNSDLRTESAFGTGTYGFSDTHNQPSSTRPLTPPEARNMLLRKAHKEILKKL